ncbi:MAG: SLBB domain-containing protein, partial [Bacteroidaceae bacterium]|nr:SLBB domain-containing protein [Bacteroidaceae bacterium]
DLEAALAKPGSPDDITLREGDRLVVPQYVNTVQISGDVLYPITVNYKKGESLDYYIKSAGGYGENARKKNVYILYAKGSGQQLGRHSSKDLQPGSRIVVPSKNAKNKMTVAEYSAMGTSAASIATMMVTIANILK